jgi:hypothetical protein
MDINCTPIHPDCMHVTSEDGTFVYIKRPRIDTNLLSSYQHQQQQHHNHLDAPLLYNSPHQSDHDDHLSNDQLFVDKSTETDNENIKPTMSVCGIYFVTDPDKVVEVQVQSVNVDCDTGGLMAVSLGGQVKYVRCLIGPFFSVSVCRRLGAKRRVFSQQTGPPSAARRTGRRVLH